MKAKLIKPQDNGKNYGGEKEKTQRAHIGGCGDSSIEAALLAIARDVCKCRGKLLIVRN